MGRYGWSYLTVTQAQGAAQWMTSDGGTFASELEMFRELGLTGWELITIRESNGLAIYYFKRARA